MHILSEIHLKIWGLKRVRAKSDLRTGGRSWKKYGISLYSWVQLTEISQRRYAPRIYRLGTHKERDFIRFIYPMLIWKGLRGVVRPQRCGCNLVPMVFSTWMLHYPMWLSLFSSGTSKPLAMNSTSLIYAVSLQIPHNSLQENFILSPKIQRSVSYSKNTDEKLMMDKAKRHFLQKI